MTELALTGLSIAALIVVLICTHLGRRSHIRQGPEVGVDIFEPPVDDDINQPSIEAIDLALAMADDPAARDWLLDKRIAAKRRVA